MNIAMLSQWHVHAPGYAKEAAADPRVRITAVWDELPERGAAWANELGATFIPDLDALFSDPSLDAVINCAPTRLHGDLLTRAARAGKHIFTEKVLTLTRQEAYTVRQAVRQNGIHFAISYPHKTNRALLTAKQLTDAGALGKLTYGRMRNVHSGSICDWLPAHFYDRQACGGGAMIDLGAHPMYLLAWFLGKPERVSSTFTNVTDRPVEDNAVSVLTFPGGAIGVSETGFVSLCDPFTLEISGTRGYLRVNGDRLTTVLEGQEHLYTPEELLPSHTAPLTAWLNSLDGGEDDPFYNIDQAVSLTEIMEAAYRSAESGSTEDILHA